MHNQFNMACGMFVVASITNMVSHCDLGQIKNMSVYSYILTKIRVGRSEKYFILLFIYIMYNDDL